MNRKIGLLFSLLLPLLLTGCLEFEQQTMSYHYDKATDTLRIFQDYRGIFGGDMNGKPDEGLSTEEQNQLASVLKGQRTFFFSNWILEFDRARLEEQLRELKIPEKRAESKLPEATLASLEKLLNLLIENVRVENGPFYMDAANKLGGVQHVTLTRCSAVIELANETALRIMKAEAEKHSGEEKSVELKFVGQSTRFIQLDGNALTGRWPMTQKNYDEAFGPASTDAAKLMEMKQAGLDFSFADDVATFKLGKPGDTVTSLTLSFSANGYVPNVVEPAKKLHVVRETFDAKAAAADFLLRGRKASAAPK